MRDTFQTGPPIECARKLETSTLTDHMRLAQDPTKLRTLLRQTRGDLPVQVREEALKAREEALEAWQEHLEARHQDMGKDMGKGVGKGMGKDMEGMVAHRAASCLVLLVIITQSGSGSRMTARQ